MSHDISMQNGRANFAYVGERPWHGLGFKVPGLMTVAEALAAGGLDFQVVKEDVFAPVFSEGRPTGAMGKVRGLAVTIRTDTGDILGNVGAGYVPIQNAEALGFMDHAFGQGAACLETVGALGRGEVVFAMARLPEVWEVRDGDPVEQWLVVATGHNGRMACRAMFTPIRVVCRNTLSAALGVDPFSGKRERSGGAAGSEGVAIRHIAGASDALAAAVEVLDTGRGYFQRARETFSLMATVALDSGEVRRFLDALWPEKVAAAEVLLAGAQAKAEEERRERAALANGSARERVLGLFEGEAMGADLAGRSAWGLYNAATQWIDHERRTRSRSAASRWEAATFGEGARLRQRAFDTIADLVADRQG